MPLLTLTNISLQYGTHQIFDGIDLTITRGQRLGLLGRNGAGKSTLMKLLAGSVQADSGERWQRPSVKLGMLEQDLPEASEATCFEVVADGLGELGPALAEYHHLSMSATEQDLARLQKLQEIIEASDGWRLQQKVEATLTRLNIDGEQTLASLSGGWKRRVALAKALVSEPDILFLDEPTNHLDIPTIEFLEEQLKEFRGAIVLVTHDRRFLQQIADTIAELDRGHLKVWKGDYRGFLNYKEHLEAAEAKANAEFDKKLAQEEIWIRQGIKARRTRNEGRVRALEALRKERSERREITGKASFSIGDAQSSGKRVVEVEHASVRLGDKTILQDINLIVQRGDRIGIVGANGAGKTTLLNTLLGKLPPSTGKVSLGTKLEIAYSDQLRSELDPEMSLMDAVCGGQSFVEINGHKRHAYSYLSEFLFAKERANTPIGALSGGEKNRAVLARLFTQTANVLVLDEPTNDLDMETLELLEEQILNFAGTVLLVSHDRDFMDNTVTALLVVENDGHVSEHAGSFSDWEARGFKLKALDPNSKDESAQAAKPQTSASNTPAPKVQATSAPAPAPKRKLSYKEQRELDALPDQIDTLETQIAELEALIADPSFYQQTHDEVQAKTQALADLQAELESKMERWLELDSD
jgi:ATP-binding cassette subfamily F protein uup